MKIRLTSTVVPQLELIAYTQTIQTGFIIGPHLGKFRIIEHLLPINFDEITVDDVYANAYRIYGDRLTGVFFNNCIPFPSDWFIETIVLKIAGHRPEFYLYGSNKPLEIDGDRGCVKTGCE